MKYIIMLSILITSVYSQDTTHFRIYANIHNNSIFKQLLFETMLVEVFKDKYQIVINTKPDEEAFIVLGRFESPDAEWDSKAYRFHWHFLSINLIEQLLKYPHKILIH